MIRVIDSTKFNNFFLLNLYIYIYIRKGAKKNLITGAYGPACLGHYNEKLRRVDGPLSPGMYVGLVLLFLRGE
jgi:hypothetical protein